jgi:antitoxin (DNA-binding transcriptional repressor) of toxin-antitoxin stability system
VNLSSLLKRAAKGEDIGILHGDTVIALRPVTVHADDYALREYGASERELELFVKAADRQIRKAQKAGKVRKYSGNLEADLAD